jgi:hypothetical protein
MKKLFFLLLLFSIRALGQSTADTTTPVETIKLRHIEGIRGFDISAGENQMGRQFSMGYARYVNENFIARLLLNYEFGKINLTGYSTRYLFIEFNSTLFRIKNRVYINIAYGALLGDENSTNEVLNAKGETFEYGLLAGANAEVYLLNKLSLLGEFKQIWDNGSGFGSFRYYTNVGLRFYL